jgi:hypothetical protein
MNHQKGRKMHKLLAGFTGALAMVCSISGDAADASPAAAAAAPYAGIPGPGLTTPAPAEAASSVPKTNFITATLNDGSKIEFEADGSVMVIAADGKKTPAPDGTLTLKDGTPFVVKDGKRVAD